MMVNCKGWEKEKQVGHCIKALWKVVAATTRVKMKLIEI